TVAGGPHATVLPTTLIEHVDAVVLGEGEHIFTDLIKKYPRGNISKVNGIWYKKNGKINKNNQREYITNLDELPHPARDLLNMKKYIKTWHVLDSINPKLQGTNFIASRGCPFNCSFCQPTLKNIFGSKIRIRSPENVVEEISFVKDKYNIDGFNFVDDTPTFDKKWVIDFCKKLKEKDLDLLWGCNTRIDTVNENLLKIMYDAGLRKLHIGVESGSQRMLDEIYHKGIKLEDAKKTIITAKKIGINTMTFFMLGGPTEKKKDVEKTIRFACSLDADEATFSITSPLPGTELYEYTKERYNVSNNYDDFDYYGGRAFEGELSYNQLRWLQKKAALYFYTNPRRWSYVLKHLSSPKGIDKMLIKLRRFM
ncbi:MAG: B12-binding domain-containing radical SAM protein, partial [Epsilonproteobacteria bacterium]|nr:B12-binding domain-containing radical SAM protein [Campylobacterota bacterium]